MVLAFSPTSFYRFHSSPSWWTLNFFGCSFFKKQMKVQTNLLSELKWTASPTGIKRVGFPGLFT
jgi:hypothetical protein